MGSNNIPSAVSNATIKASDHNALRSAFIGDHVPRDSSANPVNESGSIGMSSFRWLQGYIKNLFIGNAAENISIVADGGDCIINVGGVERARVPQSVGMLPSGMIVSYSGTSDPAEWLICDGREIDRVIYARLFSSISTMYGDGNGTDTFNVPDFRGQFLRGSDDAGTLEGAAGKDPSAASRTAMNSGGATGNNVGSIQSGEVGPHTHGYREGGVLGTSGPYGEGGSGSGNWFNTINNTGVETRPINAAVNFIIKT